MMVCEFLRVARPLVFQLPLCRWNLPGDKRQIRSNVAFELRTDAPWKDHVFKAMTGWVAHCGMCGKIVHPLFRFRADNDFGLHAPCRIKNVLHVVDFGVAKHAVGNTFGISYCLIVCVQIAMQMWMFIWNDIQTFCKPQRVLLQFAYISINKSCDESHPS